jgi:ankyrin repeat protein
MPETLPERASLAWLRKTAKLQLREWRAQGRDAKLADAQLAIARQYGFPSWRGLKAHVDQLRGLLSSAPSQTADEPAAGFLRAVGEGRIDDVRAMLAADPQLVNAVGPHPYWGGRPQALHVSIETKRREMFDLLLAAGADANGTNDEYDHWSPLMLTCHWDQPDMRRLLLERGAHVGLIEAMLLEDDALVETLLAAGPAALPGIEPNRGSFLAFARTPFAIDRLIELGVSADRKDRWGATPIEVMSRLGPRGKPLVRHMQTRGIRAEPQDSARLGDEETLAALIDADPGIAKSSAVMMGAVDFRHHDLVAWLVDRGADVNVRSDAGSRHTALHSAAWNGDLAMVKLLVAAGADVDVRDDEHDNTPCGWAEVSITVSNNPGCKDVVEYLSSLQDRPPP